ncbi:type II toxin-antitoxin system VapC family toxin [Falsiroseomonas sp.]|uniref:type II toxin-antitoxin system VapC family toxin n=1 Tax=Falsiroseomonas sp. TaxID=2870721 RepID=UPI0035615D3E
MSFVIDNSVALAWCFADEQAPELMALLDRVAEAGAVAPGLWPLEAQNGLLMAERRQRVDAAQRAELARLLRELPIALDAETAEQAWTDTIRLAERFGLSVYDASYLELAQRRRLPLATTDRALRSAAAAAGVPLLP